MPHPERAVELPLGSADGLVIFRSMVESLVACRATVGWLMGCVSTHTSSLKQGVYHGVRPVIVDRNAQ